MTNLSSTRDTGTEVISLAENKSVDHSSAVSSLRCGSAFSSFTNGTIQFYEVHLENSWEDYQLGYIWVCRITIYIVICGFVSLLLYFSPNCPIFIFSQQIILCINRAVPLFSNKIIQVNFCDNKRTGKQETNSFVSSSGTTIHGILEDSLPYLQSLFSLSV